MTISTQNQEKEIVYIIVEGKAEGVNIGKSNEYSFNFELPAGDEVIYWNGGVPKSICSYFLEIKCPMQGLCSEDPHLKIPIYVRPALLKNEKIKNLENWNPIIYDITYFDSRISYFSIMLGYNANLDPCNFKNEMNDFEKKLEVTINIKNKRELVISKDVINFI